MGEIAGNALISVYNKEGIVEFAGVLHELGWQIYASGGTAKLIGEAGVPVKDVSELVGGEAILGHRVVTLSREVYAGILADKSKKEDMDELKRLKIPTIDLVCVDMYPLEEEIASPGSTEQSIIEKTDIGGPTMLRAAAKGRRIVLSVAEQRQQVLGWLKAGKPDEADFLRELASTAEYEVTRYTLALARHLGGNSVSGFLAKKHSPTKYGENPWQENAGLYADNRVEVDPLGLDRFVHVKGWEQSFINITDIDRLLQTCTHIAAGFERNFKQVPAIAVGVKHGNACGAAGVGKDLNEVVKKMLEGDTQAIFGGVVMINGLIDKQIAETLMSYLMDGNKRLLDGVIGADVTGEALEILSREKLRVVVNPALGGLGEKSLDTNRRIRPVRGGVLEQPNYTFVQDLSADYVEVYGKVTEQQEMDAILAWAIGSTSNSNTITLVKDGQLIGNGVGQQDRVGAAQLALARTTIDGMSMTPDCITIDLDRAKIEGSVAYSDSFFPFTDGPLLLAEAGVKVILTSSGSVRDQEVVEALKKKGVSTIMVPDKIARGFYAH